MHAPLHSHVCGVCAEACLSCALECEQMANGDTHMLACAESCRQMATMS